MTRSALALAAFFAAALPSPGEAAPPPPIRKIQTPMGTNAWQRGNCLILELRTGKEALTWEDSACDGVVQGDIGTLYAWLPDFLAGALDLAETLACGKPGCATEGATVRFYLTWGQAPILRVTDSGSHKKLIVEMSTALVDANESAAVAFLEEERRPVGVDQGPFTSWLRSIDSVGGIACQPVSRYGHSLSNQDFVLVRKMAQLFYTFTLLHELAHRLNGRDCGAGEDADELTQETACDRQAFDWMGKQPVRVPPAFLAPMVALAHQQSALDPLLGSLGEESPSASYSEKFPAARWLARTEALLNRWEKLCLQAKTEEVTCWSGWRPAVAEMRRLMAVPLPPPCLLAGTRPASPAPLGWEKAAAACLREKVTEGTDLDWVRDGNPPVVKAELGYQNYCDRPIACEVTFACGTRPRKGAAPGDWRPFSARVLSIKLAPHQSAVVHATTEWTADQERMPSVRFPEPPDKDMDLLRCAFTGPPEPASNTADARQEPFCSALLAIYGSAPSKFAEVRGAEEVERLPSAKTRSWVSKRPLPGAERCTVVEGTKGRAWHSCTFPKAKSADDLEKAYAAMKAAVARCLPKATASEERENSEYDVTREATFRTLDAPTEVQVNSQEWLDPRSFELKVEVWPH